MSPTAGEPYRESDDHVPNPLYQTGIVDTTGTSGDLGGRIENASPVFAQAKADAFQNAVDAVDDPARNADEVVVFHDGEDGQPTREEGIEALRQAAQDAADNPQLVNPADTPAARAAAEEGDPVNTGPDATNANGDGGSADGGSGSGSSDDGGSQDELPADGDSKAKWVEFADAHKLDADQGLRKDDYVAAVKKEYRKKK